MNFDSYIIYHATSKSGPYTALDTIVNYSQLSYIHNTAGSGANYYFLRINGGCNSLSIPSDTLGNHYFILQPQNANSTPSSLAYFTCTSSDSTATYQWQENNGTSWSSLSNLGIYSGATSDSLVISSVTLGMNNYSYRCIVSSCTNDTSDVAVLTVSVSFTIRPQNFTAYSGTGWANFRCKSSDTTATYQWQESNGAGWVDLTNLGNYSGATSDSLVITGVTASMNNYGYRCIVTGYTTDTSDQTRSAGQFIVYDYANTSLKRVSYLNTSYTNAVSNPAGCEAWMVYGSTGTAITRIDFIRSSTQTITGTFLLYGVS